MIKDIDITGQRFNRLIAIKRSQDIKYGWICQCDCGNITVVRVYDLIKGLNGSYYGTKSCGCLDIDRKRIKKGEASFHRALKSYRDGAKSRGISFELTEDQFRELTSRDCFYCGSSPSMITEATSCRNGTYLHNGIDRLNNSIGYVIENCIPCCKLCNYMKRTMSFNDFIEHTRKIYDFTRELETMELV